MSTSDEIDHIFSKHQDLCLQLNMDEITENNSWTSYKRIREIYTLEGEQTHWLCCSLFVACRESLTPTVGSQKTIVQGNCVSLTRLLRDCNIGFREFFAKIGKWAEMASVPETLRKKIERLDKSFNVSALTYKKYGPIFQDLFLCPPNDDVRSGKSKKIKNLPCTSTKLFKMCWTLFVCVRGEYPNQTVDLVTSYHLLLCCVNLIIANAIADNRKDLINPNFPVNSDSESGKPICVMSQLCERHRGSLVDALETKCYDFTKIIRSFFNKDILRGDEKNFLNIISVDNFDYNLKSLNNLYETYVLSCGEIDEKIFLACGEYGAHNYGGRVTDGQSKPTFVPGTPITRRKYLPAKEFLSPVATATESVKKLRTMLAWYNGSPQTSLKEKFKLCNEDPTNKIEQIISKMAEQFYKKFTVNGQERFSLAEALYYQLLEYVVDDEENKKKQSLKHLYSSEALNIALLACSVEIVLRAYNSHETFPWILEECFDLNAYDFYKIIEPVVFGHRDLLTRDIIKHLNSIEEQCLESYVWQNSSPLWEKLKNNQIPTWQDVDINAYNTVEDDMTGITPHNPAFIKSDTERNLLLSPGSFSDRPMRLPSREAAIKKQLFKSEVTGQNSAQIAPIVNIDKLNDIQSTGKMKISNENTGDVPLMAVTPRPMRAGSLSIFFRKFYKLAYIRMYELCQDLGLYDTELLKKIWTIFEYSIVEQTDLMKDRHMDQILMCAIYVFFRVTKIEKTFKDVMTHYRKQAQWASHIYRSVFISYGKEADFAVSAEATQAPIPEIPAQPNDLAGTSTSHDNEIRGDIIKFYNTIYVQKMQKFALKFSTQHNTTEEVFLSPLPNARSQLLSPRKVSGHIYVHALEKRDQHMSPGSVSYSVFNSPTKQSKDLEKLNEKLSRVRNSNGKRTLPFDADDDATPQKITTRKFQTLLTDRQANNKD